MPNETGDRPPAAETRGSWPPSKSEQEMANALAVLSEDIGRIVDQIRAGDPSMVRERITEAASEVRRRLMLDACALLGISEATRKEALFGDISHMLLGDAPEDHS